MKLAQARRRGGRGFTLVELLVVFAILSVLVSLISAAVWKAMTTAGRTKNRVDIAQLTSALETFKSRYGFYPPSRLKIAELLNSSTYPNAALPGSLDNDSIQILTRMFQRASTTWSTTGINWSGRPWNGPNPGAINILEGDQCLVFFLGGIPDNFSGSLNCTGFSTNALDPSYHIKNGGDTLPPFFEFDSSRLVRFAQVPPRDGRFYSYLDTYRQRPYAYFSSGNSSNDYNRHYLEFKSSDCNALMVDPNNALLGTVWPYAEAISPPLGARTVKRPRYLKPDSFQIISAGADGLFGTGTVIKNVDAGGVWLGGPAFSPNSAPYATGNPGYDDQSNFRESTVGSGS